MSTLLAHWHFFIIVWGHHHWLADLLGWLRYAYPGMPGRWYGQYAHYLTSTYGTGRALLTAIRPW